MKGALATETVRSFIKEDDVIRDMVKAGLARTDAHMAFDLAVHAVDEANLRFQSVIENGPQSPATIQAAVIGLQFLEVFARLQGQAIVGIVAEIGGVVKVQQDDGSVRDFDGKFH